MALSYINISTGLFHANSVLVQALSPGRDLRRSLPPNIMIDKSFNSRLILLSLEYNNNLNWVEYGLITKTPFSRFGEAGFCSYLWLLGSFEPVDF